MKEDVDAILAALHVVSTLFFDLGSSSVSTAVISLTITKSDLYHTVFMSEENSVRTAGADD